MRAMVEAQRRGMATHRCQSRSRQRVTAVAAGTVLAWHSVPVAFMCWLMSRPLPLPSAGGKCAGELFGCTETARETVSLLWLVVGIPAWCVSLLVAVALVALLGRRGSPSGVRLGTAVSLCTLSLGALLLALLTLPGSHS